MLLEKTEEHPPYELLKPGLSSSAIRMFPRLGYQGAGGETDRPSR
jgi:hypothetical protein